jgi:hypothetical protein
VVRGTVEEGILRFQQQMHSQLEEQECEEQQEWEDGDLSGGAGKGAGASTGVGTGAGTGTDCLGSPARKRKRDPTPALASPTVARYNSLNFSKRTRNNDDVFLQEGDILDMFGLR